MPADFDPEVVELGDALGSLEDDGFLGVVREGIEVRFVDVLDPGVGVLFGC
ncbi:hypothetical protein LRS71_24430 [Rhodococcus pyridinivorans]|uniref:hypothetical protein n=1 Tax=Rhodococcus pyridinivorans TaxID=103816 RepID=UPI001E628786|nr:hypothetical protein [Rhodococcus pyridinivorans]MCD5422661.1 hypothetical protein [Rhodococcus pyridinivorans]